MMGNLASRVKKRIEQILISPNDGLSYNMPVPDQILQEARIYLRDRAADVEYGDAIVRKEIGDNRIETTVQQILLKLHTLGYSAEKDTDLIGRCVRFAIDHLVQNYPSHLVWTPVTIGIQAPDDVVASIERQVGLTRFGFPAPWSELEYAVQNSLASWSGSRWRVSPAGFVLAELSIPAATVFLLSLETYLSGSDASSPFDQNPWHMNMEFLRSLLCRDSVTVDIGEGQYSLTDLDPNMEYLNRLGQLELVRTQDKTEQRRSEPGPEGLPMLHFMDDFFEVELTSYGTRLLESVVEGKGSAIAVVADHMVASEVTGVRLLSFSKLEGPDELEEISKKHFTITGDQDIPIQNFLSDVRNECVSILTLRAVPPTVERVLKNILVSVQALEKVKMDRKTLGDCVKIMKRLQAEGKGPFESDTAYYVESMERNAILHGNITPIDAMLQPLLDIMLNTLLKLYRDYDSYRCAR